MQDFSSTFFKYCPYLEPYEVFFIVTDLGITALLWKPTFMENSVEWLAFS